MDAPALAEALKARAKKEGADLAGIAPARPLPESQAYLDWLSGGLQATMDYMARNVEPRQDVRRWYPEARSVLVLGFSYADNETETPSPHKGRVARYARFEDYHPELKKRLDAVLSWLREAVPGADGRAFVDTSPLLERLYARYAGLGWVGKNTMLIAPRLGSYYLLAGAALNIELPADEPQADHCGSCNRCLSACPTAAFPKERVLDAGRCISFLTIENKGPIPEDLRPGVGDWIMGCDVCQEVCPWNRFAETGPAFPAAGEPALDLAELASLDAASFKRRFARTPLSRPKRRGLLRNVLLAMGNSRDPRFRPVLQSYCDDADELLREQARWSLERLSTAARN